MFKKLSRVIEIIGLGCMLTFTAGGCSVYMAANKGGTSFTEISDCQTVADLESKGAQHVCDGKGHIRYYQLEKPSGSATRAVTHGILDVVTLGCWEIVGTPIEGAIDKDEFYAIKVKTGENNAKIKDIQISR